VRHLASHAAVDFNHSVFFWVAFICTFWGASQFDGERGYFCRVSIAFADTDAPAIELHADALRITELLASEYQLLAAPALRWN
jgi:hypothetical protein